MSYLSPDWGVITELGNFMALVPIPGYPISLVPGAESYTLRFPLLWHFYRVMLKEL
jgi:hypothetical protein